MGKFKERYIEKSNQEFKENKNKIDFDVKKITVDLNGEEVLLEDYLKVAKGNIYVVAPKDRLHLWGWNEFREHTSSRLLGYDVDGKKVLYQILESKNEITYEELEEFGLYIAARLK